MTAFISLTDLHRNHFDTFMKIITIIYIELPKKNPKILPPPWLTEPPGQAGGQQGEEGGGYIVI